MLGQPDSGVLFTDPRAGGRGPGGCREPSRSAGSRNVDSWRHGPTAIGSLFPRRIRLVVATPRFLGGVQWHMGSSS